MHGLQASAKAMSLDELAAYLSSDDAPPECMMLSDLDGFLTGIVVGPELIPPSEWLPEIWGGEAPLLGDAVQAQAVLGAIMDRYIEISRQIEDETFQPILWHLAETDEVIASDWAYGFAQAIALRPRRWEQMAKSEAGLLLLPIMLLCEADEILDWPDLEAQEECIDGAVEILPVTVITIAGYWRMSASEKAALAPKLRSVPKTGRNDPCPCGSGKKFKKCCGASV
jgi:uncharacterized protein